MTNRKECVGRGRGPLLALFATYVVMAFPDGIGVMSARFGMAENASTLVFLWFALLPIAAGRLCGRLGGRPAVALSLAAALPAFALLWRGSPQSVVAAMGFALAGIANVLLQTTVPAWAAERFGAVRLSGMLTAGLFIKTAVAISLPFAVAALAALGDWRLVFVVLFAVTVASICLVWRSGPRQDASRVLRESRVSVGSIFAVIKDCPTLLAAIAFAVAIVADIAFNLSVPIAVPGRFGGGDMEMGVTYAVLFGVKLPVMLVGSMLFVRKGVVSFLLPAILAAVAGTLVMLLAEMFVAYLCGVALFAFGYANMYGFVYGVAAPRHPSAMPSVATLLTMSIAGGALASPLVHVLAPYGTRSTEALVLALTVALLGLFVSIRRRI